MGFNPFKLSNPLLKCTDDELMSQIAKGSSQAFNVLFERHGGLLLGFARKLLGSTERAEEASQEIWMKVVRLSPQYKAEGYFKAWVVRMIKNHCLNILRKDKRIVFKESIQEVVDQESSVDFEKIIFNRYAMTEVSQALDSLPEKQRITLSLLLIEELSYEELAKELDTSLGAVKSIVHRGRKSLKEKLSKGGDL